MSTIQNRRLSWQKNCLLFPHTTQPCVCAHSFFLLEPFFCFAILKNIYNLFSACHALSSFLLSFVQTDGLVCSWSSSSHVLHYFVHCQFPAKPTATDSRHSSTPTISLPLSLCLSFYLFLLFEFNSGSPDIKKVPAFLHALINLHSQAEGMSVTKKITERKLSRYPYQQIAIGHYYH